MVRAPASGIVGLGLIPSRVKTNDFEIGIHSFPASHSALTGQCGGKPASLLVVPLGKALSGITPFWCGKQMAV